MCAWYGVHRKAPRPWVRVSSPPGSIATHPRAGVDVESTTRGAESTVARATSSTSRRGASRRRAWVFSWRARASVDVPSVLAQSSRSRRSIVVVVVDETWMVGDVHAIEHGTGDVDVERGRVPRRGRMARVVVGDVGGDGEGVVKHPSFKVCGV